MGARRRWTGAMALMAAGALLLGGSPVGAEAPVVGATRPAADVAVPPSSSEPRPTVDSTDPDVRPLDRPVVVLYGDSLAWEAENAFRFAFAGHPDIDVHTRTMGGIAICDVLEVMALDAESLRPGAVVIEFSGNNLTDCMRDASGEFVSGTAYYDRYEAGARIAIEIFAGTGTQVIFAGAPIANNDQGDYEGGLLNAVYRGLAEEHPDVRYVDAGASVLDQGRWTPTLPCLPAEPCTGGVDETGQPVNLVRAPDGGHFCPASKGAVRGVTGECPVWSSGAFRFGNAMASPVIDGIDAA